MGLMRPELHAASQAFAQVTTAEIAGGIALFVASLVGSAAAAAIVLCRLPVDYLVSEDHAVAEDSRPRLQRILRTVGKNVLGVVLVVLGVALSLPGIPGQGILTILVGVMLLDVPGKRKLERRILCRPAVLRSVNRLRARFGRPPLLSGGTGAKGDFSSARPAHP
jgi:hypothetical protein